MCMSVTFMEILCVVSYKMVTQVSPVNQCNLSTMKKIFYLDYRKYFNIKFKTFSYSIICIEKSLYALHIQL